MYATILTDSGIKDAADFKKRASAMAKCVFNNKYLLGKCFYVRPSLGYKSGLKGMKTY